VSFRPIYADVSVCARPRVRFAFYRDRRVADENSEACIEGCLRERNGANGQHFPGAFRKRLAETLAVLCFETLLSV